MKAIEATLKLNVSYKFDTYMLDDNETMTEEEMKEVSAIPIIECLRALGEELAEDGSVGDSASVSFKIVECDDV